MTIETGAKVWIPCEVKRTAFPDVRLVKIESPTGCWDGFLDVRQLREQIDEGKTAVVATVVASSQGRVSIQLPGQVARHGYLTAPEGHFEQIRWH
jgi:hypothetical protein